LYEILSNIKPNSGFALGYTPIYSHGIVPWL